jgi:hypothetical protein
MDIDRPWNKLVATTIYVGGYTGVYLLKFFVIHQVQLKLIAGSVFQTMFFLLLY